MFSLLGSYTTNQERGNSLLLSLTMENHKRFLSSDSKEQHEASINLKLLAEKANYIPAQKVLQNEGIKYIKNDVNKSCFLCHDLFSKINPYVEEARKKLEDIEFNNFLVGSRPNSQIINEEDKFKGVNTILEAESFKSHFNRVVGKELMKELKKPPEFNNPDVLLIYFFDFEFFNIEISLKSLFVFGKYNKLTRGIPQTHWICKKCMGNGCKSCNFSGKQYLTSVEELISPEFIKSSNATDSKFHGAGREDIDVRMLGEGRPFILELRNPTIRSLDLFKIERKVNKMHRRKIKIRDLRYSTKAEVIRIKSEAKNTRKIYRALVETVDRITKEDFKEKIENLKRSFEYQEIHQRTPHRVSHRRADKIRDKFIYKLEGKFIKSHLFEFMIETQGGTYIKELISGDDGRTSPSFSQVFEVPLICKELDVLEILL
jgi:tRNA pseudouridine synthase 10